LAFIFLQQFFMNFSGKLCYSFIVHIPIKEGTAGKVQADVAGQSGGKAGG